MEKISFQPNVPVRMALKYADGRTVEGRFGDQEYFTLMDGRCMYLSMDAASKVYELSLRPGEPFELCKYWSGKKGDSVQWDARRVDGAPRTVQAAQATRIHEAELERDLRRSLEQLNHGKSGASVPTPGLIAATAKPLSDCASSVRKNGIKLRSAVFSRFPFRNQEKRPTIQWSCDWRRFGIK